ncbi:MAG TPA: CHASE2 domain-containing protein [Hyphomicrobiales bacterium]|nr:CHASE2 domain-containing protein [Hyphomicrobiales bacterium]
MRFPAPARWPILSAIIITPAVLIVVGALVYGGRVLESLNDNLFDWRTAVLGDRMDGPHPDIAVVLIGEQSVALNACRSPMDRAMLAKLVRRLNELGAKVIGLDFFFDQTTLPHEDKALERTFAAVKDHTPIVLASYDSRLMATPIQHERQKKMLTSYGLPAGYVNIVRDYDGGVRRVLGPDDGEGEPSFPLSFPQQLARAAGVDSARTPERIAWLIPPAEGDTFTRIPASALLGNDVSNDILRRQIEGRIVLIGGSLIDQRDQHLTPLSTIRADGFDLMPGVFINAHIVAQLLDGRDYHPLGNEVGMVITVFAAFFGVLYGWYFRDWRGPVNLPPLIVFFIADIIAFSAFRVIIPFIIPAVAWVLAAWLGEWVVTKEVGDEDV